MSARTNRISITLAGVPLFALFALQMVLAQNVPLLPSPMPVPDQLSAPPEAPALPSQVAATSVKTAAVAEAITTIATDKSEYTIFEPVWFSVHSDLDAGELTITITRQGEFITYVYVYELAPGVYESLWEVPFDAREDTYTASVYQPVHALATGLQVVPPPLASTTFLVYRPAPEYPCATPVWESTYAHFSQGTRDGVQIIQPDPDGKDDAALMCGTEVWESPGEQAMAEAASQDSAAAPRLKIIPLGTYTSKEYYFGSIYKIVTQPLLVADVPPTATLELWARSRYDDSSDWGEWTRFEAPDAALPPGQFFQFEIRMLPDPFDRSPVVHSVYFCLDEEFYPTETPTPTDIPTTPTPTPEPTLTESPTPTPSPSPSQVLPTISPSPSPTDEPSTPTPTMTPTLTPTLTPEPTPSPTDEPTTPTPSVSPSPTPSPSPSQPLPTTSPSPSPTETQWPTATGTPSPTPSATETSVPTDSPTPTLTLTPEPTATESPTPEPTPSPTEKPGKIVFDFASEDESAWVFKYALPLTIPTSSTLMEPPGYLRIQATDNQRNFGYWESPEIVFVRPGQEADAARQGAVPLSLSSETGYPALLVKYRVVSDQTDPSRCPQMRLRATGGDFQQSDLLVIHSTYGGEFSPTAEGKEYSLLFFPNPSQERFRFQFDLLNFDKYDAPDGILDLDWVEISAVESANQPELTRETHLTFATGNACWERKTAAEFTAAAFGFDPNNGGAITLSPGGNNFAYGYWGSCCPVVCMDTSKTYYVRFQVRSSLDPEQRDRVPSFRCRLNSTNYQGCAYAHLNSKESADRMPTFTEPVNYWVCFQPDATMQDQGLLVSFDLVAFDATDDLNAILYLDEVEVFSAPQRY